MIHQNLPFGDYCAIDAVNNSSLKTFLDCPARYKWEQDNKKDTDSPAMATGRLWHTAILEPENLERDYACLCSDTQERLLVEAQERGSKAKAFSKGLVTYKEWKLAQDAREIVTEAELSAATQGRATLYHGEFKTALQRGEPEMSVVTEYESEYGPMILKGRMDLYDRETGTIWDVKTTRDASPAFGRIAWGYNYLRQTGFYRLLCELEGLPFEGFKFVAVETTAPFLHATYSTPKEYTRWAAQLSIASLERLAYCREINDWPGYGDGELTVPDYAAREIMEDLETMPCN